VKRQKLFGDIQAVGADAHIGPRMRLSVLGKVAEKYILSIPGIDKYVIMPNHIHMIIRITGPAASGPMWASAPTVSDRVRSFKILVSKAAGKTVFQRSFYDHVIRDDNDYLGIWKYIDSNPSKWAEDKFYTP